MMNTSKCVTLLIHIIFRFVSGHMCALLHAAMLSTAKQRPAPPLLRLNAQPATFYSSTTGSYAALCLNLSLPHLYAQLASSSSSDTNGFGSSYRSFSPPLASTCRR